MSKPVKRKCPRCGKVKLFRADCKTCGCPRPKADPLANQYWLTKDASGQTQAGGQILSRISPTLYLVRYYDLDADGPLTWEDRITSVSSMRGWAISDEDYSTIDRILRKMEADEQRKSQAQRQ
jgi:hypothetical protein